MIIIEPVENLKPSTSLLLITSGEKDGGWRLIGRFGNGESTGFSDSYKIDKEGEYGYLLTVEGNDVIYCDGHMEKNYDLYILIPKLQNIFIIESRLFRIYSSDKKIKYE